MTLHPVAGLRATPGGETGVAVVGYMRNPCNRDCVHINLNYSQAFVHCSHQQSFQE
jgi:hypothetical protein